ncbi:MAG: hypothetical protein ENTA_01431 [Enterocloster clostridioformis]
MTVSEHIRESDDVEMSVAIAFCIVEYLQQSDIIKAISMDDKTEMISGIADDVMDWLAGDWENKTEEKTIC